MDLSHERTSHSWLEQEYRRRLLWAVHLMEQYVCEGNIKHMSFPSVRVPLPCDEDALLNGEGYISGLLCVPSSDTEGEWLGPKLHTRTAACMAAQHIIICSIRTAILTQVPSILLLMC